MGAGLAGVATAWFLAKDGHEVVVLEREAEVAAGASSANTGIIAASRALPWSAGEIGRALRFGPELWLWGVQHLVLRSGGSYRRILEAKARLVRYSQRLMQELAREIGFELELLEPAKVAELDPAIEASRLAGALYAPGDQWADSAGFCRRLAERCAERGVEFSLDNEVLAIEPADARVREVATRRGADAFVCALGVMERRLREQFGIHTAVYPVKGFSATVPVVRADRAPRRAMIDESRRVAFSPMGDELRVTGGAEFAGYGVELAPQDFAPLYDAVKQLFPGALDYGRARVRACQRPMTPETTPRFGTGRYHNLWFNIGLGHMGFAMAAGAGRITADLVSGETPAIDLEGLRIRRH